MVGCRIYWSKLRREAFNVYFRPVAMQTIDAVALQMGRQLKGCQVKPTVTREIWSIYIYQTYIHKYIYIYILIRLRRSELKHHCSHDVSPRAFEERYAAEFQRDNPQLELNIVQRPSKHPFLEAFYGNIPKPCLGHPPTLLYPIANGQLGKSRNHLSSLLRAA